MLKTGKPLDASRDYVVAGWASVNQGTEGPPIWDVISKHITGKGTVTASENTAIKITGQ